MSFQIIRREEINAEQPSSKRRRVIVKQELADEYPEYPTLMDLNPAYAEQVNRWNEYVRENYPAESYSESESESVSDTESESDSEAETDSDSDSETDTESDTNSESEMGSDSTSSGDSGTDNDTVDLHDDEFRFDFIASESEEDLNDSAIF